MGKQAVQRLKPVNLEGATTPLLKIIANNARLVAVFKDLTQALVKDSQLKSHERWLVTMRMAWRCKCDYEFGRKAADAASPSAMQIVTASTDDPSLTEDDRLLLVFTDQIHAGQNVEQAVWDAMVHTRSPAYMVELVSVAGLYLLASSVANTCGAL